jgi:ABC-type transport system involved in cytochrome c biogenesis ATPase subunit
LLGGPEAGIPDEVNATECCLDFVLSDGAGTSHELRFLSGNKAYVDRHRAGNCYGYIATGKRPKSIQDGVTEELRKSLQSPQQFAKSTWPRLVFFPSERRDLVDPNVKYKSPGKLDDAAGFVFWWERPTDQQWSGTTHELLFSARWADLNAKETGNPQEAVHFERYVAGFRDLTGGKKELGWTSTGELVAKIVGDGSHPVAALSSGERHIVLLLAELRRRWRPGSLVLIDEPELHLHDAWQTKLYDAVLSMQRQLGGQVVLATQSHHLFEVGEPGTKVLIGSGGLR